MRILNPKDGPADWAPHTFIGSVEGGKLEQMHGMAKRCFAVMCTDRVKADDPETEHVFIVWLPFGLLIGCGVRHGAQAYRVCDALLDRFPEFAARDVAGARSRVEDVEATFRELKVLP